MSLNIRPRVLLMPGRDKRVGLGHPWVYSNEIRMDPDTKDLAPGTVVTLMRADRTPIGVATFNPGSLIAARLLSRDAKAVVDADFIARRLVRALALRERLYDEPYYRLVHAEADSLPGLVVDRFGDALAVQFNTAGMEVLADEVLAALDKVLSPKVVVLRNDSSARGLEGLRLDIRLAKGELGGPVQVPQGPVTFMADLMEGQKTGWFFDQRDNRDFVARLAPGQSVLDVFTHSGGFGLRALAAGATSALMIDRSDVALNLARQAADLSGLADRAEIRSAEAFKAMEELVAEKRTFGVVVTDPPSFVKSKKEVASGLKGYRKMARLGASLVAPGGFLYAASCSHNVNTEAFTAEIARGVKSAGRGGRIIWTGGAAPDHPVHPFLPESAYLKSLVLQLD